MKTSALRTVSSSLGVILLSTGCVGQLYEVGTGERSRGTPTVPDRDASVVWPDAAVPSAPGTLLPFVTVGERCVDGAQVEHLVLSASAPDCAAHAAIVAGESAPDALALRLEVGAPASGRVRLCDRSGACAEHEVSVTYEADGGTLRGQWRATIDGQDHVEPFVAMRCDYEASAPSSTPVLVEDLEIRELAIYQGVEAIVARDGEALASDVPIVAGRDALLRVFVEPLDGFAPRDVQVRVHLGEGEALEVVASARGQSRREDLESTLNVRIPGERLELGASLRVELLEIAPACRPRDGAPPNATFPPADGTAMSLEVASNGGPLRIVLVPVRYDADGSGRLPNLDEALLDRFHDFAYALFPVREVELVVRDAPMAFGGSVSRDGGGWSALLNACRSQRVADDPPDDTYYYCVFVPARSFGDYCGGRCTAGLGFVPDARDVSSRTSIGLGYPGSEDTFAHEVGHTLGRPHAPCGGVASSDPGFPHEGGRIGVWGYDLIGNQLRDPASFGDLMGYCDPKWISDYNYARIFSRLQTVRASAFTIAEEPRAHHTVVVDVDGSLSWGGSVSLRGAAPGEAIRAEWIAPSGARTSTLAYYSRASDLPGGVISVEADAPAGSRLVIEGIGTIAL